MGPVPTVAAAWRLRRRSGRVSEKTEPELPSDDQDTEVETNSVRLYGSLPLRGGRWEPVGHREGESGADVPRRHAASRSMPACDPGTAPAFVEASGFYLHRAVYQSAVREAGADI